MMNAMLDAYDDSLHTEQAAGSAPRASFAADEADDDVTTTLPKTRFQGAGQDSGLNTSMVGPSGSSGMSVCGTDDIRLLRAEDEAHKQANPNSVSAARMKAFMEATPEPFARPLPLDSRWVEKQACCAIS